MDSREFINLRCWQLIENGNIIVKPSSSCQTDTSKPLQLSKSAIELNAERMNVDMNICTLSLSKSLGAKVLSENEMQSSSYQSTNMCDEVEVFVDANETPHDDFDTNNTTTMNIGDEKLTCDRIYILSGASIKYDGFPSNSSYTRYVCLIVVVFVLIQIGNSKFCTWFH